MKKTILILAFLAGFTWVTNAQVDGKAIGLRFGYGWEASYQHPLGDNHRMELDLGLHSWRMGLTGIYHWVWDLSALAKGFNWYAGPGATIGTTYGDVYDHHGLYLGVAGQIGIEFNFEIPLQLSLDYRPSIFFVKPHWMSNGSYDGICLAARYRF